MLLSIFLAAWHVYPVLYVSLVQRCAYAYRTMEVQKLMPGGSCTYSISSLKWCQGGPHLQSNLTTKVKRSTTSNQILATPAATARQFPSRGSWRGLRPVPCVWARDMAYLLAEHCASAMSRLLWQWKELPIYMRESPGDAHSLPLTKVPTTLQ